MALPTRQGDDRLLKSGEFVDIRRRLKALSARHDLATVIACAFDHRTRMLPFFYADMRMPPAGVRAVGSALIESGFPKTRIVLQHWNKHFRPSQMRLDGRLPDMFLVSSMSLHTAACKELIRDVCRIPPSQRPLVIAGGSVCIYEPWEMFFMDREALADNAAADVAVTGEVYILLNLLEVLLSGRNGDEPIRQTYLRARDQGALDAVPGLIYSRTDSAGRVLELVDTGIQRLVKDLDEQPFPTVGYSILEHPSRRATLASAPMPPAQVSKLTRVAALELTYGCKFSCNYCPIPLYNQGLYRVKSGRRIAEEMSRLHEEYGLRYFFGTDDNFFNDHARALDTLNTLVATDYHGKPLPSKVHWGTEVTVHDSLAIREHLPLVHRAGIRYLWLGVEDMSGHLVRKGQTADKTTQLFELLVQNHICPMPMMMHHDVQPLLTSGDSRGLLNQVNLLRKAGAVSLQVLILTPSAGSKSFNDMFTNGMVYGRVAGRPVEARMLDGNHVLVSRSRRPWLMQFNILAAYMFFYNPVRLVATLLNRRGPLKIKPFAFQFVGMWGLAQNIRRTLDWTLRLMTGRIERQMQPPHSPFPMHSPDGGPASHGPPDTSAKSNI